MLTNLQEDHKQEEVLEREKIQKNSEHRKNIAFKRASPNERKATRTPCRHPKMTRIRRERADTRGRIRTHASILVYRPMYNECFLKRTFHTYTTSPCTKKSSKTD